MAAGAIGGEQLNAADFQIPTSIGLAMTLDDLRPAIESRPAGASVYLIDGTPGSGGNEGVSISERA